MCVGHIKFYVCRTYELLYNTTACDTVLWRGIYVYRTSEPLYSTLCSGVSTADAEIWFPTVLTNVLPLKPGVGQNIALHACFAQFFRLNFYFLVSSP